MPTSVADAVSDALVAPSREHAQGLVTSGDLGELQGELDRVAEEALAAQNEGVPLCDAVRSERFPALRQFHQDLRDSLFVEIPRDLEPWVEALQHPDQSSSIEDFGTTLTHLARPVAEVGDGLDPQALQQALAELMVFEAVRLRLLVASWESDAFERLGGDEADVDAIAWEEVEALLGDPALASPDVRPLHVMFASASVALARDAASRADELRNAGGEVREELSMRAKLRAALRELRLTESVLLENALTGLLGGDRVELRDLQTHRPVALEGMSRQAMDQRVSRGRRALAAPPAKWPRRRRPALFDLMRG